jgi:pSer/pThr/pTyr-binding forkhead associated (FHA) protein
MPTPSDAGKTIALSVPRAEPQQAVHYLTVVQGVTIRRAAPITAEPLIIGRDPSRAFHLPDADVSRSHCALRLVADTVLVRDLGSTNGTFIDGVRVTEERALPVSSHLQIGRHALKHELLRPDEVARHEQFASELERARRYVEALIPEPLEHGPLRTEWCFVPSSVLGGDALGYHELDGGLFAVYLLDVCGHGVASAMHSASVLNTLRSQTLPGVDMREPSQVLARLNEAFAMDDHGGMYFSLFYGVVDAAHRRMRYSSAGHPPAIVLGPRGEIRRRLAMKNPPIGAIARRAFAEAESELELDERLYVFSDGVYEIVDRDGRDRTLADFERELAPPMDSPLSEASRLAGARHAAEAPRLSDPLRPSEALRLMSEPQRLYKAACAAAGSELLADDFTLLLLEHAPRAAR